MQYFYYFGFCGNRGVVYVGYLVGVFVFQLGFVDEDVLNGIVEYVFYVEYVGYVGWWDYDIVRFVFVGFRVEVVFGQLVVVLFGFGILWVIMCGKFYILLFGNDQFEML